VGEHRAPRRDQGTRDPRRARSYLVMACMLLLLLGSTQAVVLISGEPLASASRGAKALSTSETACLESQNGAPTSITIPAGFDFATASTSQLAQLYLPHRPPGSNEQATAAWLSAMENVHHVIVAAGTENCAGRVPSESSGPNTTIATPDATIPTSNWGGWTVPYTKVGSKVFEGSEAKFVVKSVPSGTMPNTEYASAPQADFWTGVGVTGLQQAGVVMASTKTPQYRFWFGDNCSGSDTPADTWFTYTKPKEDGVTIAAGQTAFIEVTYEHKSTLYYGYFWEENESTGNAFETDYNRILRCPGWSKANFIVERPQNLNKNIPPFGTTTFSEDFFWSSSSSYTLNSTKATRDILEWGSERVTPTGVRKTGGTFTATCSSCSLTT
jgi:hypothetical protein